MQAGDDINESDPDLHWFIRRRTRHAHESTDRLNQQVVSGEVMARAGAEAGNRAVDQARVILSQVVVAQPEPLKASGFEVLHENVCAYGELAGTLQVGGVGQVEGHRTLVAIH